MTLPEHVLNRTCHHDQVVNDCEADECQEMLSQMEDDAVRERLEEYAETGDDQALTEVERSSLTPDQEKAMRQEALHRMSMGLDLPEELASNVPRLTARESERAALAVEAERVLDEMADQLVQSHLAKDA